MDFNTTYNLEKYILNTKWNDLPSDIKDRAIACGIDLMLALIIGSKGRQFESGVSLAKDIYKDGDVQIVGSRERLNFIGAAVAMGHASNSFDIDDGHNMIKG